MLIVDAGPLIAAASTRDRHHRRCVELLTEAARPLIVPALVVTEVAYVLVERLGTTAERAFAGSIRDGELLVEPVDPADWERVTELLETYEDLPLGMVDASVVAACERLGQATLATLDHRHFGVVRPRHVNALTLLPA
jgi:uncharacterized protein